MSDNKFIPKPGQVDYTNIRYAPVIDCVLKYRNKILIVKRSEILRLYPGYWSIVTGFLDDKHNFEDKVKEEIFEETGITGSDIESIQMGEIFHVDDPEYKKTWIIHPVLVKVKTDKVKIDWEAESYKWVTFEELEEIDMIPGFDQVLDRVRRLI